MSDSIKHVSDASFSGDVLQSDLPVLVDYWAEWCGPCKMIAPLLDEIAAQYQGRVTIAKLNVDENPSSAAQYGIRGIPTLMLFKGGKAVATKVGALSRAQLRCDPAREPGSGFAGHPTTFSFLPSPSFPCT